MFPAIVSSMMGASASAEIVHHCKVLLIHLVILYIYLFILSHCVVFFNVYIYLFIHFFLSIHTLNAITFWLLHREAMWDEFITGNRAPDPSINITVSNTFTNHLPL